MDILVSEVRGVFVYFRIALFWESLWLMDFEYIPTPLNCAQGKMILKMDGISPPVNVIKNNIKKRVLFYQNPLLTFSQKAPKKGFKNLL